MSSILKNCGTGAGGFQEGNTCARGGGSNDLRATITSSLLKDKIVQPADLPDDVAGIPVVYSSKLTIEARALPNRIEIGKKFFDLPDVASQNHTLVHEWVHLQGIEEAALNDPQFWDKLQSGNLWGEPDSNNIVWGPGGNKPNENVIESVISYYTEPEWLKEKYPGAYSYFDSILGSKERPETISVSEYDELSKQGPSRVVQEFSRNSKDLNRYLREGPIVPSGFPDNTAVDKFGNRREGFNQMTSQGIKNWEDTARKLDEAIRNAPEHRDVLVYRALHFNDPPGEEFTDEGFPAVTIKREIAERFGDNVIEVKVPKDVPLLASGKLNEKELILPRNIRFIRVDDQKYRVEPSTSVEKSVRILPHEAHLAASIRDSDPDLRRDRIVAATAEVAADVAAYVAGRLGYERFESPEVASAIRQLAHDVADRAIEYLDANPDADPDAVAVYQYVRTQAMAGDLMARIIQDDLEAGRVDRFNLPMDLVEQLESVHKSKRFLYHGTNKKNLSKILEEGLTPGKGENDLYFTEDPEAARKYAVGSPDDVVILQVDENDIEGLQYSGNSRHGGKNYRTSTRVPGSRISVSEGCGPRNEDGKFGYDNDCGSVSKSCGPRDDDGTFGDDESEFKSIVMQAFARSKMKPRRGRPPLVTVTVDTRLREPTVLGALKVRRIWRTEEDDRVCTICDDLSDEYEDYWDDEFPDGPPAHPNCRCRLDYEYEIRQAEPVPGRRKPRKPKVIDREPIREKILDQSSVKKPKKAAPRPKPSPKDTRRWGGRKLMEMFKSWDAAENHLLQAGSHLPEPDLLSVFKSDNCGIGPDGFEEGNDCARGDGLGSSDPKPSKFDSFEFNRSYGIEVSEDYIAMVKDELLEMVKEEAESNGDEYSEEAYLDDDRVITESNERIQDIVQDLGFKDLNHLAHATGAPSGAHVQVFPDETGIQFHITDDENRFEAIRVIYRNSEDKVVIQNEMLTIEEEYQGKGLGTDIFSDQVAAAAKAGISKIYTVAARGGDYNGYYTWPRLGYNADFNGLRFADDSGSVPREVTESTNLHQLMSTKIGRDWWKENGETVEAVFDLAPGSNSMKIMEAYLEERSKRKE